MTVLLRPAEFCDHEQLFAWRNDPWLMSLGSSGKPVIMDEHLKWFEQMLKDGDCALYIIVVDQVINAGSLRFNRINKNTAITSVYLSKEYTGKGYGVLALRCGCKLAFRAWRIDEIVAIVKEQNTASLSAFLKADFISYPADNLIPLGHCRLILTRNSLQRQTSN